MATKKKNLVEKFERSPYLDEQSIVIDNKFGTRISPREGLKLFADALNSPIELFARSEKYYAESPCFTWRNSHDEPAQHQTYHDVGNDMRAIGAGLTRIANSLSRKCQFVGICGRNSPQWICTHLACSAYGLVSVPLYNTLGEEGLKHILEQTEMSLVVCHTAQDAKRIINYSRSHLSNVFIIENGGEFEDLKKAESGQIDVMSFDELLELGQEHPLPIVPAGPDDLLAVCYTSGSTGPPKGVLITHGQRLKSVMLVRNVIDSMLDPLVPRSHMSYMPLAHVFEQVVFLYTLSHGGVVSFLTTDVTELLQDLKIYKPTVLFTVPRVLSRLYSAVQMKVSRSQTIRKLLDYEIRTKLAEQKRGIFRRKGILDKLFFGPVRERLGGNVQFVGCASAPLKPEVMNFIRAALSCQISEAYGSTECDGMVSSTLSGELQSGIVGSLVPGFELKLIDVPDMGLVVSRDNMGEIMIKGAMCTKGYFKNNEQTQALFDEDGFLHSGDIGMWTSNGALKIVDRCKNLFKLSQGEYIAPEKVEQVYSGSLLVTNVFLDGHSLSSFCVAVVVPNLTELRSQISTKSMRGVNYQECSDSELCSRREIRQFVLSELQKLGKAKGLSGFEQAKRIILSPEPFSIENGLLTVTMKMSRLDVRRHFSQAIKRLYLEEDEE